MGHRQQPLRPGHAIWRGFTMRCPSCGTGKLFGRFLKVADHCPVCSEEFFHHRADDFPAYIVILALGHILVPAMLEVEINYAPPAWVQLAIWLPLAAISALALLQPTKGAIVALQWQLGMHGFAKSKPLRLATPQYLVCREGALHRPEAYKDVTAE